MINIQSELQKLGDPKRAEGEKKYLKSPLKHYGVSTPKIDKLAKDWIKTNNELSVDQIIKFTDALWKSDWHEERSLATSILSLHSKELTLLHLPHIEHMVNTATGWAHLDFIAAHLVGALYEVDATKMAAVFRRWIDSDNFWVRRAALLGQLIPLREGRGDFKLFSEPKRGWLYPIRRAWYLHKRTFVTQNLFVLLIAVPTSLRRSTGTSSWPQAIRFIWKKCCERIYQAT